LSPGEKMPPAAGHEPRSKVKMYDHNKSAHGVKDRDERT
jgi:hypothetical protein